MPESSIAEEISRISGCRNDILSAISSKGVTVPEGSVLSSCPSLIASIQTGWTPPTASINSSFLATGHFSYECPFTAVQKEIPVITTSTAYTTGLYPENSGVPLYAGEWSTFKSADTLQFTGIISSDRTFNLYGWSSIQGLAVFTLSKTPDLSTPSATAYIKWDISGNYTYTANAAGSIGLPAAELDWKSGWQSYEMRDYDEIYVFLWANPYGNDYKINGYSGDSADPLYHDNPGPEYWPAWTYTAEAGSTHPFPEYDLTTTGVFTADYTGVQRWEDAGASFRLLHSASGNFGTTYSSGPSTSNPMWTESYQISAGELERTVSACGPTGYVLADAYNYTFGTPTSGYTGYTGV